MMRIRVVYAKDGTSTHEVLERSSGENCTLVYNMTGKLGKISNDEITGPDCDPDQNFEGGSSSLLCRR